ncbi:hypothetical protein AALP_AA3G363000 [Arabis alpina]|uniref:Uncharacterized protein n=1 Tax=Arabis alpina TaxID=50452 RepID=A0A087HE00_ARAAL|nr:hypothetical protein AALP_AA3G363000 [Arabis alpina]
MNHSGLNVTTMYPMVNPHTTPGAKPNPAATQLNHSSSSSDSSNSWCGDVGAELSTQISLREGPYSPMFPS